jgi:hypothetical protein
MSAPWRTCLLCCAMAIGSTCIHADSDINTDPMAQLARRPVIDTSKLEDMRGGLNIAGLDYTIGAVMRTKIDGTTVLESAINFDNMTSTGVTNTFAMQDAKGLTQVTHNLNKDRIVATVINQADQRQIQVELGIDVVVHNFEAVQNSSIRNKILNSLGGSIAD